jgi:dihydrolipoamide dehydrogenase
LIATGSVPVLPPIPGIDEGVEAGAVLTNREILDMKTVPSSLVIVGGGVIGLEMASYFNTAGSKVTVIEMLDHVAGAVDRKIAEILMKNYTKKGIEFKLGSKVKEIRIVEAADTVAGSGTGNRFAEVVYEADGQSFTVSAEKVLMSVGRKPAIEGLGLEAAGVHIERGRITTDLYMQTNVPGIYAAGDVNGISMLAHTAYREAEVCIANILGEKDAMNYDAIPSVIYTNPEVACVGETEESARDKGIEYEAITLPMMFSGRYAAENEGGDGICKILVDRSSRKLLGVHMISNYSSEIIYGAGLMIQTGMKVDDIRNMVFPHPTVSEIIREVLYEFDI